MKRLPIALSCLALLALGKDAGAATPACGPVTNNAQTCTYSRPVSIWVGTVTAVGAQATNLDYVQLTDTITSTLSIAVSNDSGVDARVRTVGVLGAWVGGQNDVTWVQDSSQNLAAQTLLLSNFGARNAELNNIYGTGSVVVGQSFQSRAPFPYTVATWNTSVGGVSVHNIGVASVTIFEQDMQWTAPGSKGTGGFAGSMAQVASAGGWGTIFTLVNTGATASSAHLDFFDNSGTPLPLPIAVVGSGGNVGAPVSSVDQALNPGASVVIDSTGDSGQPQAVGWAQLLAPGNVSGFGIFRFPAVKWEAVVPLETRSASSYVVAFDNTGSIATGVALANVAATNTIVTVIIRNDAGTQLGSYTLNLPGLGHTAFMLNEQFPVTVGRRGTAEFRTASGGQITVLGLRANGAALTTLPVLANVPAGGGSIAHVTFGGGFNSLIYLVNTGASPATFTLSFFDDDGKPLNVSLFLLNPGTPVGGTSLTRTLAAGAILAINVQTQGGSQVAGSARLTTTGTVGGFEIFQWTTFGQEATVPLETRTPSSFVLAFDDTNGLTTGVALSNAAGTPASITAKVNDSGGNQLQSTTVLLPSGGHTSFLLPELLASTQGRAGTVEFVVPQGGKLGVIGLRAKADGTLTTIPVLVK